MRRVALVLAVFALICVWMPSDAWAGPPAPSATDADSLLRLFKQMRTSVAAWQRGGQDAARVAFAALAALNVAWLGVELFSSPGDIRSGLGKLARELLVMSVLYSLIELGPQLARQVVDFLRRSADGIGGGPGEDQTWNALQEVVKASIGLLSSGEVGYLEVLWLGLCVVVVIALVGLTGAIMLVTEGATELILGLGAIVLGGGGAIWTRFLVQNYLRFSFSAGLALYVMRFVQSFVIGNLSVWAKEASGSSDLGSVVAGVAGGAVTPIAGGPETIFTLLLTVIIQLVLVMAMPTVAVMLASGGVGKLSEWAGLGAAQRLGGMGAQGLRQMAATMSGGAARGASRAGPLTGEGQGLSVLGSAGGAMPPASAREQGSGNARGVDSDQGLGGGLQQGGSTAPIGAGSGSEGQAGGGSAGNEAREGGDAQRSAGAAELERAGSPKGGTSSASAGASAMGATSLHGREGAVDGASSRASSRHAWKGQETAAEASASSRGPAAGAGKSGPASGRAEGRPAIGGPGHSRSEDGIAAGVLASDGAVSDGSGGRAVDRAAGASEAARVGGSAAGAAGGQARAASNHGMPSSAVAAGGGAGSARGLSGAGAPAPAPARGAGASTVPAPAAGQGLGVRGGASASASALTTSQGDSAPATGAAGGRSSGRQQVAPRVASVGPNARGAAGKRG